MAQEGAWEGVKASFALGKLNKSDLDEELFGTRFMMNVSQAAERGM